MKGKSLFLLLLLVFNFSLFFSCTKREPKTTEKRKELAKEIAKIPLQNKLLPNESLLNAIKKPNLLPNYTVVSYQYLDQDRLYEKINGAADGYIKNHGFIGCAYVELKHKLTDTPFITYIYDMGLPIQAFGIYSSERNPSYNFIDIIIKGAYLENNAISFWKGKHYIKIELQSSKEKDKKLLFALAKRLASLIEDDYKYLSFFRHFPKEKQIKTSDRYYLANFNAQKLFRKVYELKYKKDKVDASIFITEFKNNSTLKKAIDEYKQFLSIPKLSIKDTLLFGRDNIENTLFIFATQDNYLIGLSNFSKDEGKSIINKIKLSLKE